jgi:hypothetical protein
MEMRIKETLERIEWEHDVDILYACESGSRAWGFASSDSDYDVRFIYAGRLNHYLTVAKTRDVIELPIVDDLDINGWDVKKALSLLRVSNPTLLEWLHSPVVYRADSEFLSAIRDLSMKAMRPRALCYHYFSMAKNNWRNDIDKAYTTAKKYLYTLRALLCVKWIVERNTIPPVSFDELVRGTVTSEALWGAIDSLLTLKAESKEKEKMLRHRVFDAFILTSFETFEDKLPAESGRLDVAEFDKLFVQLVAN